MNSKQMTLKGIFFWFFLLSAYLTVLTAYSSIRQAYQSPEVFPRAWLMYLACWVVLLLHYVCCRQMLPGLIHTLAPLLATIACIVLDMRTKDILTTTAGAAWLGAAASFPVSVAKSIEFDFGKESNLLGYVCLNVFVSIVILSPLCVGAYWILTKRTEPALVFAVLLSLWCGLYQSMSTSERFRQSEFFGMSTRVLITSGLLAAVFGPILYWRFSSWYGLYFLPPRYSPTVGVPVALVCGVADRWRRMWLLRQRELLSSED